MELFTRQTGDNGPNLVLLHGLFGSHENLGVLARGLAAHCRVHAVDLRNHGRSPHADTMNYPDMAADVRATMDAHGLEQAVVIGHSMGGKVAMELALTAPERVAGLVALDIAPVTYARSHDTELTVMQALDTSALASRSEADKALAAELPNPAIRQFLLKNLVRTDDGFAWRIPLDTIADAYPDLLEAPSAGTSRMPALFIRGGASDYVTSGHEREIHERFPSAAIETIADAAHWVHIEAPEAVTERLLTWVRESRDA